MSGNGGAVLLGHDVIFPSAVPFLSLIDLLRLRRCAKENLWAVVEESHQLSSRMTEIWSLLPDQSSVPQKKWQDLVRFLNVASGWFDGDTRILRALFGFHSDGVDIFSHPLHGPRPFVNTSDADAFLIASTHYLEDSRVTYVDFTGDGRPFYMALLHHPAVTPEGAAPTPPRFSARVWDRTGRAKDRIRDATAEDEKYRTRYHNPLFAFEPEGIAKSSVRWVISLWNWRRSRWEVFDLTTSVCILDSDLHLLGDPNYEFGTCKSVDSLTQERTENYSIRKGLEFAVLPLTAGAVRGVLAGPSDTVVAKVKVQKFSDWSAGSRFGYDRQEIELREKE
uniref:Uncharacterized protein n=1 Tax=Chromera velia CCMP2878 TaxID=1169474 RepID=A0A0G4FGT6_9ALVE|mmetsp:Transcript_56019/g.109657  ORF Transcript_56019/g.109657 Transcript_56019/m.109657 type:complete len:336 (+) Transcript_56019:63-1070(+)|eukprot:Cvel_16872.t1-p1 / transcript=Cvel_16872.t1 / gene=Cvel_16872 / organism=Chromera_velia_CCMP2878 / gene_product=hypothetical protein / transcript_product=hypothetical protein / location=Cvel_scaffold1320:9108-10112(-) / protein_length=335 / sequence_SO=supercontig / SO=protein_coding / is_pseudo=false